MRGIWVLKMDIRRFFDSIDHEILLSLLRRQIADYDIFWLIERVIYGYHSSHGTGKGVPIGNLTSQIFANIYLSELDYFVKHCLRAKHYFRYADDFVMVHWDQEHLHSLVNCLRDFLNKGLALQMHPQKIVLRKFRQGIDFVGCVLLPRYRVLRTSTKQRMFKKMAHAISAYNQGIVDDPSVQQTIQSYLGLLKHGNNHKLAEALQNDIWRQMVKYPNFSPLSHAFG